MKSEKKHKGLKIFLSITLSLVMPVPLSAMLRAKVKKQLWCSATTIP